MNLEPKEQASGTIATLTDILPHEGFEPLGDRLLVKPDDVEDRVGSLYIPQGSAERPFKGTVVAVGPGLRDVNGQLVPLICRVGDRILFGKYSPTEIALGEKRILYYLIREPEVFGRER